MNKPKKFAVFDIDGTLFRWQLFHELVEELTLVNAFPKGTYRLIDNAWQQWRGGTISYATYEHLVIDTMQKNLPSLSVKAFDTACQVVVDRSWHKVHYFTHHLLKDLQKKGYVTIAISGSQQEIVDLFADRYDFDIKIGVIYERSSTVFTGNIVRSTYGKKGEILRQLIANHNFDTTDSYALGDSDGDIAMLQLVDNPIAFNPSEGLFQQAKESGWRIVVERKNIVYKLEPKDGLYILEEARPY